MADTSSSARRAIAPIVCAVLVALLAIKSRDYLSGVRPAPDSGAYAAAGMVVAEGRVLYRDVNHSAPVIAFLDAAALTLGDGTFNAIRAMEVAFAVAGGWLALFVAWRLTNRLGLATVLALLFVMLASRNFLLEEGNVTEEFGMVFALAGVAAVLASHAAVSKRSHTILNLCSGAAFGLAALSKEPFIYSSVAWLGFTIAASRVEGAVWKRIVGGAAWFIGGMAAVFMAFVLYLLAGRAFIAWADSIAIAMRYAGLSRELMPLPQKHWIVFQKLASVVFVANRGAVVLAMIGVAGGVVSLVRSRLTWRLLAVALAATAGVLLEYYGASTSGRPYGHYFLQTLPSYFVLACCGASLLATWVDERARRIGVLAVAALLVLDVPSMQTYKYLLSFKPTRIPIGDVSTFVRAHRWPEDHLWSPSLYNSRFYVETGLTPSVSYSFVDPVLFQDTRFFTRTQRLERLAAELRASPPEWMVLRDEIIDPLGEAGIMRWTCANYARLPHADVAHGSIGILYARLDRLEALGEKRVPDPFCSAVTNAPALRGR